MESAKSSMFYGPSGTGKTTQAAVVMAKWMWKTYKLKTRLISADGGGWEPVTSEGLDSAGLVQPFNLLQMKNILANMRKLSRGWWPKVIIEDRVQKDLEGNELFDEKTGNPLTKKTRVLKVVEDKEELAKVGLYVIEKASSIADAFMSHAIKINDVDEAGKPLKIGAEGVTGRYVEDGEIFGGNATGHYNVVQSEMYNLFRGFGSLPVKMVIWTSSVGKGLNKRTRTGTDHKTGRGIFTGEGCYCPQLVGDAKNHLVPEWVGECFHFEDQPEIVDQETGDTTTNKRVRAFYVSHPDKDTDLNYLCKSRVGISGVDKLRERFPGGFIELGTGEGEGIDQYFKYLDELRGSNIEKAKEWMKENG